MRTDVGDAKLLRGGATVTAKDDTAMDKLDRLRCLSRATISSCAGAEPWESKFLESFDDDSSGNRTNRRSGAFNTADDDAYTYVSGPTDIIDRVTSAGTAKEMSNTFKGELSSVNDPNLIQYAAKWVSLSNRRLRAVMLAAMLSPLSMIASAGCGPEQAADPPSESVAHLFADHLLQQLDRANDSLDGARDRPISIATAALYLHEHTLVSQVVNPVLRDSIRSTILSDDNEWVINAAAPGDGSPYVIDVRRTNTRDRCSCVLVGETVATTYQVTIQPSGSSSVIRSDTVCVGSRGDRAVAYVVSGAASNFFELTPTQRTIESGCILFKATGEEWLVGGSAESPRDTARIVVGRLDDHWWVETSTTPRAKRLDSSPELRRFEALFRARWDSTGGYGAEVGRDRQGARLQMRECWDANGILRTSSDESIWSSVDDGRTHQSCL